MNLSVPEEWEPFIRAMMQSGPYRSKGEVLDEALRPLKEQDQEHAGDKARVEALLIEGSDSGPSTPMTADDWDEIEREGERIVASRRARKARPNV